ncbi:MAG: DUF4242 domain-containing protein [Chloroflexi bacterium]|nr:DUF4242 domain-containing protein [Chloroflexota bacterium]
MKWFIDGHSECFLPQAMLDEVAAGIRSRAKDSFGVRGVNLYYNNEAKKCFCLSEAPSADAVRLSHAAKGLGTEEITEIKVLA